MLRRLICIVALTLLSPLPTIAAPACPALLAHADRLVLVTARGMATSAARVQLFTRRSDRDPWRVESVRWPARIGRRGMAWGYPFRALADGGLPAKHEGDDRVPAGVYSIGHSFGFAGSSRQGYLRLTRQTVCVSDPSSPDYSRITNIAAVGPRVRGEHMRRVWLYRRGLQIDYPTSRRARAGSCIFIHVWKAPSVGTSGCVALSEPRVRALQNFAARGAVIAILPRRALKRWAACLPHARGYSVHSHPRSGRG